MGDRGAPFDAFSSGEDGGFGDPLALPGRLPLGVDRADSLAGLAWDVWLRNWYMAYEVREDTVSGIAALSQLSAVGGIGASSSSQLPFSIDVGRIDLASRSIRSMLTPKRALSNAEETASEVICLLVSSSLVLTSDKDKLCACNFCNSSCCSISGPSNPSSSKSNACVDAIGAFDMSQYVLSAQNVFLNLFDLGIC